METMQQTSAEYEATQERFFKLQDRTAKNFGYGATVEGTRIAQASYERLAEALAAKLDEPIVPSKGWDEKVHRLLKTVSPHYLALYGISNALRGAMSDISFLTLCCDTGRGINHELFANELRLHDEDLKKKIEKWVSEKHGNLKHRLQAARSVAKKMGFSFVNQWKPSQLAAVGTFVLDTLLVTLDDMFVKVPEGDGYRIEITDGAAGLANAAMKQFIHSNPVFLPSLVPPVPWTDWSAGGPVDPVAQKMGSVVRTRHRETIAAVKAAIKSGQMQPALDALNAIQATPWRINTDVLAVIKECHQRAISVPGLPSVADFPMPKLEDGQWERFSDDEKKVWRTKKAGIRQANRALRNDRMRYDEDMETAEVLAERPQFFIPHNLDWRGREYAMTTFNFQREDRVRSLFLFADFHEPIGEEGIAWLKVHVANCGDFGKVSKKSYDERLQWVDDHLEEIKAMVNFPTGRAHLWWTDADKPFLFLAACKELCSALAGDGVAHICRLPASWDGSCSGLQHLCLMTRAEEGAFVNLTDLDQPQDVYQMVADRAYAAIAACVNDNTPCAAPSKKKDAKPRRIPTNGEIARRILGYNGNRRTIVKRNTMTYSYSSGRFGMAEQHMSDLMEPLKLDVLHRKYDAHPFGPSYTDQSDCARFLAGKVHAAIEQIVNKPAKAMEFLQGLAGALAHEGKPLEWTTPIGLPWSNRYHESTTEQLSLWMHDGGVKVRYKPLVATGFKKDIDKRRAVNGVAPNFVHACDASHLLLTVLAAKREGIRHFALVHDSFGCPLAHAARFQGIIRETLVEMYEKHDVLTEVLQRAKCDLSEHNSRLSEIEDKRKELTGTLNCKSMHLT